MCLGEKGLRNEYLVECGRCNVNQGQLHSMVFGQTRMTTEKSEGVTIITNRLWTVLFLLSLCIELKFFEVLVCNGKIKSHSHFELETSEFPPTFLGHKPATEVHNLNCSV